MSSIWANLIFKKHLFWIIPMHYWKYTFILFLKRKVAWKFNFVEIKGYPNMPSIKGVLNVKYVWSSQKVTLKINIPSTTPTWNTSTLGSRWIQEVWMTFLDSCRFLWPRTASWPTHRDNSGPKEVLTFKNYDSVLRSFPPSHIRAI